MYWLGRYLHPVTLTYILRSSAFYTFYIDVQYLLNYKAYNYQTFHSASPQCKDSAGTLTGWPWPIFHAPLTFTSFTSPFHMSSTVRPSTTKPYIVLLLNVLTWEVPWPGDHDLYFALQWLTHFTLMFGISSNIRPTTTKPCIVLHLIALAWQVPWPGDLDLYLTHFTLMSDNLNYKAYNHHTLHSAPPWCTELAGTLTRDLDLYFTLQWLLHILRWRSIICIIRKVSADDIAIRGNGTGLEYICPTRHVVYIFFNPVFQLSTAKNEINLLNNHILIVAPVTFAPAGVMMPSVEFLLTPNYTHNQNSLLWPVLSIVMKKNGITYEFYEIKQMV